MVELLTEVEHKEIYMRDTPIYIEGKTSAKIPWFMRFIE
jgi:hypothetical protein